MVRSFLLSFVIIDDERYFLMRVASRWVDPFRDKRSHIAGHGLPLGLVSSVLIVTSAM